MRRVCRHCGCQKASRPRGLCWRCFDVPGIRNLYPSTSKYARRGLVCEDNPQLRPPQPTSARPGSPEKLAVLEQRAECGEALWHPEDQTWEMNAVALVSQLESEVMDE